jgi:hypothetical protein
MIRELDHVYEDGQDDQSEEEAAVAPGGTARRGVLSTAVGALRGAAAAAGRVLHWPFSRKTSATTTSSDHDTAAALYQTAEILTGNPRTTSQPGKEDRDDPEHSL